MNNLNALRDEVFGINKNNGWHEQQRSYGELTALVHSEVSEALEDYRTGHGLNETWYEHKLKDGIVVKREEFEKEWYVVKGLDYKTLGKPCGIPSELADIVIRILDICGLYGWDIEKEHENKKDFTTGSFGLDICRLHCMLSESFMDDFYTKNSKVIASLDNAVQYIELMCEQYSIDLEAIIRQKLEYNKTRGYKHGGKVI